MLSTPNSLEEPSEIQIKSGMGLMEIAKMLEDEQIILNRYPFITAAKIYNGGKPLQAGEFAIPAKTNMLNVLDILQNGQVIQRKFTITEGQTSWEVVQALNEIELLEGEITDIPPEGSLLPDTYFYSKGDSRESKIARMQNAMAELMNGFTVQALENLPFGSFEEVIILASIVEKETGVSSEYPKVAGVFINRLNIGMPLQSDPTVIYGMTLGEHESEGQGPIGRRLLRKDLRVDTPYNTYTRNGLPPSPIANPGRAAIEAVLNPAVHDYLYFVADGSGGHAFGKTLAEHNRNVAKWRKFRASQ